jgi:hypothetical protein
MRKLTCETQPVHTSWAKRQNWLSKLDAIIDRASIASQSAPLMPNPGFSLCQIDYFRVGKHRQSGH